MNAPFAWRVCGRPDAPVDTCTILTTVANARLEPLHERMPVILDPQDYAAWLDTRLFDKYGLLDLLQPAPSEELALREVSRVVNKVANDSPACIEPEVSLFD